MVNEKSGPGMKDDRLVPAGMFVGGITDGEPCSHAARVLKGLMERDQPLSKPFLGPAPAHSSFTKKIT